jgi:hypothetical protein
MANSRPVSTASGLAKAESGLSASIRHVRSAVRKEMTIGCMGYLFWLRVSDGKALIRKAI